MNNQGNEHTDIADMLGHMLRQIKNLNSKLERIESRNTNTRWPQRLNVMMAIRLPLEMIMRITVLMIGVLLRKKT